MFSQILCSLWRAGRDGHRSEPKSQNLIDPFHHKEFAPLANGQVHAYRNFFRKAPAMLFPAGQSSYGPTKLGIPCSPKQVVAGDYDTRRPWDKFFWQSSFLAPDASLYGGAKVGS
jgi:hypothetical protein